MYDENLLRILEDWPGTHMIRLTWLHRVVLEHGSGAIIRIVVVCVIIGHELGIMNRIIGELTGFPTLPRMLRPNIMHKACSCGTARVGINHSTHSLVPTHSHTYTHSHSHTVTHCHSYYTHTHTHTHTHTAFASAARGSLSAGQDSQRRFWWSQVHRRGLLTNLISMSPNDRSNVHVLCMHRKWPFSLLLDTFFPPLCA